MVQARSLTGTAKALQSAANRLALAARHRDRDTILAGLYADGPKGAAAQGRLDALAPALAVLEADVVRLREELGELLDHVLPAPLEPPEFVFTEPPKRKRKKRDSAC